MNLYTDPNLDDQEQQPLEELPIVEVEQVSPMRKLIRRMGLGAFAISLSIHLAFLLLAIFFLYKWVYPPEEKIDFLPGGGGGGGNNGDTVHKIQQQMRQKMVSSSTVAKRLSSISTNASFTLPDADNELLDVGLPMDIGVADAGTGGGSGGGHGTGHGTGTGSGRGPGKGFGEGQLGIGALIPTIMKGRCTDGERLRMLRDAGGTPAIEEGVKRSLQWIQSQQDGEGAWGNSYKPAMTGLALLCYLGHCEFTNSKLYGTTVSKAITYLMNVGLKNGGKIGSNFNGNQWVYEHAIATYALAEALTFSRTQRFPIPELDKVVEQAAAHITGGQNPEGAWNYNYSYERSDTSVTGWQLQALKAAKESKVKMPELDRTIRNAMKYLSETAYKKDGVFAYSGGSTPPSMTSVATLCMQQWDKGNSSPAKAGVRFIKDGLEDREKKRKGGEQFALYTIDYEGDNADLYSWYYAAQVMRNAEGREWDEMNKAILEEILPAQDSTGHFKGEGGGGKLVHVGTAGAGGSRDMYRQTLCTLILEVYYRFLPATSAGRSRGGSNLDDGDFGNFNDLR